MELKQFEPSFFDRMLDRIMNLITGGITILMISLFFVPFLLGVAIAILIIYILIKIAVSV